MAQEEHVDFIAKEGVTIYTGGGGIGWPAGSKVRLPKSHADDLAHLRAEDKRVEPAKVSAKKPDPAPGAPLPTA